MTPRAILFDLDDTILQAYGGQEEAWLTVTAEFAGELAPLSPREMTSATLAFARPFWANAGREQRLRLSQARREIIAGSLAGLTSAGRPTPSAEMAERLADRFTAFRDEQMRLFPDAHAVIDAFKARGVRLALLTNGSSATQRGKVERFDLAHRFDHIQIEGEHGFGKPEEQAYRHALAVLGVDASQTWMVGDNLEWDVAAPQRIGIHAVWVDTAGTGLPEDAAVRPDRIVRSLSELLVPQDPG